VKLREISLRGLLAESAVIFASVLAALWADAVWQNRADRRLERYYLDALSAEMLVALEELDSDQSRREGQISALDSLTQQFAQLGAPAEDVARWVDAIIPNFFYVPPETVINEISETGRLELFKNARLRSAVMSYRRTRTRLAAQEAMAEELQQNHLVPYLLDRAPRAARGEASVGEANSLMADEKFRTLIEMRQWRATSTNRRGDEVRESIRDILALVEASGQGAL